MKKFIVFISLFFLTVSNLHALNANEILEIIKDRSLKYEEAIEILNMVRGEELLNLYIPKEEFMLMKFEENTPETEINFKTMVMNIDEENCPICASNTLKRFMYCFEFQNGSPIKGLTIVKCSNCRLVIMYEYRNNIEDMAKSIVFWGKISKKDFKEIQENIKNKITYKEALDISKDLHFWPARTSEEQILTCLDCDNISLREIEIYTIDKNNLFILICKNKKCKFFALFKENTETFLFDCLYLDKYNKLEDIWSYTNLGRI